MLNLKSPKAGRVVSIFVSDAATVQQGQQILRIDDDAESKRIARLSAQLEQIGIQKNTFSIEAENQRLALVLEETEAVKNRRDFAMLELEGLRQEYSVGSRTTLEVLGSQGRLARIKQTLVDLEIQPMRMSRQYADRRTALDIISDRITKEIASWNEAIARLTITAPIAGTIRLFVAENSLLRLGGTLATIE